jgi:ADP-glucose type glycogen/starch synthase
MFHIDIGKLISSELMVYKSNLSNARIHLAEDRAFYYRDTVYSNYHEDSIKFALAFQREIINNIIPKVSPDLVHCNDWMTGLVPAAARRMGIPCLFTVHNIHTQKISLDYIEDRGIDSAEFWNSLYFQRQPVNYEESRSGNPVDMLTSGIFASHFINTVSPTFLDEIVKGFHSFIPSNIQYEIACKQRSGCARGILNAPDETFLPESDVMIAAKYSHHNHAAKKIENKVIFQRKTGLQVDPAAPIFFWPSRLDPVQKGCQLMTDILYRLVSDYGKDKLQVAIVANGAYERYFHEIVRFHNLHKRVAVCKFDESLSHLGYAASDFMLMPSKFEPCGLPQMISPIYGSLSVVHDTGGLHDTVEHLDMTNNTGNGFVFKSYDAQGLRWAIDQAMSFYQLPQEVKSVQISRVMQESRARFNHSVTAQEYIDIYEQMLERQLTMH